MKVHATSRRRSFLFAVLAATTAVSFVPDRGVVVRVDPAFGVHPAVVAVRMTRDERRTVAMMTAETTRLGVSSLGVPRTATSIEWKIEPSAVGSRTLALSRQVLARLQFLLEDLGLVRVAPTYIVVARSQAFINDVLESIDCFPNLVRTGGVHLMGATLCNRRVVVINLTGYLFLLSAGDRLTSTLESAPEPAIRNVNYKIADRNISGLAHEWVHIARASANDGRVAPDEPAWVREGIAELLAGVARVLAFAARMDYVDFHVVRLRKFADWRRTCTEPLRRYRADSDLLAGCEYYLGTLAMEYLVARMGGLAKVITLFRRSAETLDFSRSFLATYGMTLENFETRMDFYLGGIAALPDP